MTRNFIEYPLIYLSFFTVSATPPPQRPWITCSNYDRSTPSALFSVMCYNVLCERYATRQMYGYCPQWALNWEFRKKGILDEIRQYG